MSLNVHQLQSFSAKDHTLSYPMWKFAECLQTAIEANTELTSYITGAFKTSEISSISLSSALLVETKASAVVSCKLGMQGEILHKWKI